MYTRERKPIFFEFSVAGRELGTFLIFASMAASWIGPALTMGLVREGFKSSWLYLLFGLLSAFNLLMMGFLFSPQIRKKFTNAYSPGGIVGGEHAHQSQSVRMFSGILTLIYNAGFAMLWMFIMLSLGSTVQLLHPDVPDSDQLLLNLAEFHYHDVVYGIFIF